MEALMSAVTGDLVSRFISFIAHNFCSHTQDEDDYRRLERVLLRVLTIVEEAEGRHITNQGMLLQLKMLIEDMYVGHYMLDRLKIQSIEEDKVEGEASLQNQSFAMSTLSAAKRLRFAYSITKSTPVASGTRTSAAKLQEQVISFLVCNGSHDCPNLDILPVLGPHRVGKKTLVQHACKDERVRSCFTDILFFKGDDLGNGEFASKLKVNSGKCLLVIEFSFGVDEVAWANFKSYLQNVVDAGSKIVLIGRTQEVAKFGTARPIWMKSLSQEEYWYYFKALAFGSMDPDEHPRLASLGMQLATEMKGSFLGANILGEMLRSNLNPQFWNAILSSVRGLVQEHLFSSGVHPEDLLERNSPVDFPMALVGAHGQRCLVYDLREASPGQDELPLPTSQEVLTGGKVPAVEKFDVLVWKSRIPPYCSYIATYEKQKPQRMVGKRNRLALRETSV
ncbi:unnamed protein product [Urochloa decumbens]|uniref:Rx N-terminal domain-containing protein n=1 Tax=Urochloa decumbens TaxID=240449 RepID=A0ABC9H3M6_9POAL